MKTVDFKRNLVIALTFLLVGAFGVPSNGLADLQDGSVGYWSFDEDSGDSAYDYSGNNDHEAIESATWATGYFRSDGDMMFVEGGVASHFYEHIQMNPVVDLAIANCYDDSVSILLGDGEGGFGERQDFPVGNAPEGLATGDFSGDGILDLAVTNFEDDSVSVLLGDGSGGFSEPQAFPVGDGPHYVITEDFDGDTALDLAVMHWQDDFVSILLGDGEGSFGERQDYWVRDISNSDFVAGDFNGDTRPDLALVRFNDSVFVLLNDGSGVLATPRCTSWGGIFVT